MKNKIIKSSYWVIVFSFVFALILEIVSIDYNLLPLRPEFAILVLMYWTIYTQLRIGVAFVWIVGVLLDVIHGNWLGLHCISFLIIFVVSDLFARRVRMFGLVKKVFLVFSLTLFSNVFYYAVQVSKWDNLHLMDVILPSVTSAMLWPVIYKLLSRFNQKVHFEYLS
jgi:rod shape-determining protein MreD